MAMVHKLTVVIQMTGHGEDPVYYFTLRANLACMSVIDSLTHRIIILCCFFPDYNNNLA